MENINELKKRIDLRERKLLILEAVLKNGNTVNAEQVAILIDQDIKLENDKLVVMNKGQIRYKENGQPVSIEEYILEFLEKNPHLVRSRGVIQKAF